MDGGAWQATVHGAAKSRTQLSSFTFTFQTLLSGWYLRLGCFPLQDKAVEWESGTFWFPPVTVGVRATLRAQKRMR